MNWDYILPFKGRGSSSWDSINFVCRHEDVYIMDNHRAALWCWQQHLAPDEKHSIVHIDQHYDTRACGADVLDGRYHEIRDMSLQEYLNRPHSSRANTIVAFDWDTYLSIHLKFQAQNISHLWLATWKQGAVGNWPPPPATELDPRSIPGTLPNSPPTERMIINIDIDIQTMLDRNRTQEYTEALPDSKLAEIGDWVASMRASGRIAATTIALSPPCARGWEKSEESARVLIEAMGLTWRLPR